MQSIKELYKIGHGPSSSHTMAPWSVIDQLITTYPNLDEVEVTLLGSLALTGVGHLTDYIITKRLGTIKHQIIFDYKTKVNHPNTLIIKGYQNLNQVVSWSVISTGGGSYQITDLLDHQKPLFQDHHRKIYPHHSFSQIKQYCQDQKISLVEYVYQFEDDDLDDYLMLVWETMKKSVENGLNTEGVLPGKLGINRKAKMIYQGSFQKEIFEFENQKLLSAFAYGVAEENASGGVIVTAPTCGASGVVPAVLYYLLERNKITTKQILEGLAVCGLIGVIVKENASISGALCGCQAEIGTACSMAAGCCATIMGLNIDQIEAAAEIALEHSLGLTCDPILGYVQIPCIERNAIGALKSINATMLATFLPTEAKISFDQVVATMYQTGLDLNHNYKETSQGGLASLYLNNQTNNKTKDQ